MKSSAKQDDGFEDVSTQPVKSFFVSMLTRDIKLEEAILDLLDNCVDGILRSKKTSSSKKPYAGFWAEISFDGSSFSISDNCGGIPWNLHNYAFRMGRAKNRPPEAAGTVGVYGIGMKRAIFKLGRSCLISTQNEKVGYEIEITPKWIDNEDDWLLPVTERSKLDKEDGTEIVIGDLHPGIGATFGVGKKDFAGTLERMIATHYAFIIDKGFSVKINGLEVRPQPTRILFENQPAGKHGPAIRPFIYRTKVDDVEVYLAIGFTRPIPSQEEALSEQEEARYSALDAGWTIVCNDRAVVYCDRTEMTGWGEAKVPRFHNQFIAISGVLEFRSSDATKLPTTTTKRGIDASSTLFLQIKNKMRDGMLIFTDYTNKWKSNAEATKSHFERGRPLSLEQLKTESRNLKFKKTTRTSTGGAQYRPTLPMPKNEAPHTRRISFSRPIDEIESLSEYFWDEKGRDPSEVGDKCFDVVLREASK